MINNINIRYLNYETKYLLLKEVNIENKILRIRKHFSFNYRIFIANFNKFEIFISTVKTNVPKWAIGTSKGNCIITHFNEVISLEYNISYAQLVLHEFMHIIINKISNCRCPIWLNEGLAMHYAGQLPSKKIENIIEELHNTDIVEINYQNHKIYDISYVLTYLLIKKYGLRKLIDQIRKGNINDYIKSELLLLGECNEYFSTRSKCE